jgi:hypothetical protein
MDYLRQTIDSEKLVNLFELPVSLRGRKVDVIVLPANEPDIPKAKRGSSFGCLRKYADPSLINQEFGVWARVAREKYEGG